MRANIMSLIRHFYIVINHNQIILQFGRDVQSKTTLNNLLDKDPK